MSQITGRALINVNGTQLRSENGATLDMGGAKRDPIVGGGVTHGFKEDDVPASMDCKVYDTKDLSIKELNGLVNATVIFETDTGKQYLMKDAFTTEPCSLDTGNGQVGLKMSAIAVDELL